MKIASCYDECLHMLKQSGVQFVIFHTNINSIRKNYNSVEAIVSIYNGILVAIVKTFRVTLLKFLQWRVTHIITMKKN